MKEERPKPFWTSVPGILTGIATLITAIVGLLGILYQIGLIGGERPKPSDRPEPAVSQPRPPAELAKDQAAQGFRVVEMLLRADPLNYSGPCPVTITFSGRISVAGGGGKVSYKFLRSDGASAPIQTLDFASAGSQNVTTTWRLGSPGHSYDGWQAIKTVDPEEKESNRATFHIRCQ